jgi:hypothetical protein
MWGNPTRERERSYYYASGKYKTTTNLHFQPRKIPHSTKSVPHKSASFFMPKPYCCPTSSVPRFPCPQSSCTDCSVRPKNNEQKIEIASKSMPKIASIFVPNLYDCTECTDCMDPYSTASHNRKIFRPKIHRNFFLGNRAHFPRKTCPLCCSLSSLKHAQKISLTLLPMCSQHPPDVFTTCLAHYPMHSFII